MFDINTGLLLYFLIDDDDAFSNFFLVETSKYCAAVIVASVGVSGCAPGGRDLTFQGAGRISNLFVIDQFMTLDFFNDVINSIPYLFYTYGLKIIFFGEVNIMYSILHVGFINKMKTVFYEI